MKRLKKLKKKKKNSKKYEPGILSYEYEVICVQSGKHTNTNAYTHVT